MCVQPPVAKKRAISERKCSICGSTGHSREKCTHLDMVALVTPDPDVPVLANESIGVLDTEFSVARAGEDRMLHEAAVVVANFTDEKWVCAENEFHMVVNGKVFGWAAKHCKNLRQDAAKSKHNFTDLFMALVKFIKDNKIIWYKAHNGIPADFLVIYQASRTAGITDPLLQLAEAGVKGFIDPGRFVPFHKI